MLMDMMKRFPKKIRASMQIWHSTRVLKNAAMTVSPEIKANEGKILEKKSLKVVFFGGGAEQAYIPIEKIIRTSKQSASTS